MVTLFDYFDTLVDIEHNVVILIIRPFLRDII